MPASRRREVVAALAAAATAAAAASWWWRRGPAEPPPPRPLTLAVNDTYLGTGLIAIAMRRGYFSEEGLLVQVQRHSSGRMALEALLDGRAEMATVGDTPFMFAVVRGRPAVILATIATVVQSHGIVARRDHGIATLADLAGKTVGLTVGTDGEYLLSVLLAAAAVDPRAVQVRHLPPEALAPALAAGEVDAVSTWEPWLLAARSGSGAAAVSFFPELGLAFSFHLVARPEAIAADPQAPVQVLRALARAERFLAERPQQGRDIVAAATAMAPATMAELWRHFDLRLKLPQALLTMLEDQARWAQRNGHVGNAPMPNFLDAIYLPAMLAVQPASVSLIR